MTSTQSSKPKYPTVTIRTKDRTKPPVGANTEVLLDGKKVPFCYSAKFEAHARGVSRITLEMYGYGEIDAMGEFVSTIIPLKFNKNRGTRRGRKA